MVFSLWWQFNTRHLQAMRYELILGGGETKKERERYREKCCDRSCDRSPEVETPGGRASGGRQSKSIVALTTVMPC